MEVCRLCLDLQSDNTYLPLDGTYKDMVQVVAPELNLQVSNAPIVCNECSSNLDELFAFKTKCFENEQQIRPKCENTKNKFRLKEILDGTTNLDELSLKTENAKDRVCRTCLAPIECESFTILRPSEPDAYLDSMLAMCLPEIDLELTKDPVMCESCLENLQTLHHFKSTCLDIEDKLTSFCETHGTNSSDQINLNAVLESETLKMGQNSEYANIKSEFNDESEDVSMRSENDLEMTGDTGQLKQEEVDIKSETDPSAVGSDKLKTKPTGSSNKHTKEYRCPMCSYTTFDRSNLRKHRLRKHQNRYENNDNDMTWKKCLHCSYKALFTSELNKHVRFVHEKCKDVDETSWKKCKQCSFKALYDSEFSRHMKSVHVSLKEHKCSECSFRSSVKPTLVRHLLQLHGIGDPKNWKCCPECSYKTLLPSDLRKHIKSVHDRIKEYECCECSHKSTNKANLRIHTLLRHRKMDEGIDWKKCSQCAYKALYSSELKRHVNNVHLNLKEHACSACDYRTSNKYHLKAHVVKRHTTNE